MSETPSANTRRRPSRGPSPLLTIGLPILGLAIISGALIWGFSEELPFGTQPTPPVPAPVAATAPPPVDRVEPAPVVRAPEPEPLAPVMVPEPDPEPVTVITVEALNGQLPALLPTLNIAPLTEPLLTQPNATERTLAMVDNMRQGEVPYKLLPVARPKVGFPFIDNGLAVTMDPAGFERYDGLAKLVSRLDVSTAVDLYQTHRVTLDTAWQQLGNGDLSLERAILSALELIMLTPETPLDARLIKHEANWIYEDEALESLPALQKQVMRMGPDNAERIKGLARDLRGALLDARDSQ